MRRTEKLTRRSAMVSMAALASCMMGPGHVWGFEPAKSRLRFSVLGDWGTGDDDEMGIARQMIAAHRHNPFDFVLTAGDNIYPDGSGRHFARNFEKPFSGLLTDGVKFHAVLGNHDVKEGRRDQLQYPLFNMKGRRYYTLSHGDGLLDIFMLDSTDFSAVQLGWVEKELRASKARWKLAVLHHPLYSSGKKHGSELTLRRQLEPLFLRYGAQAVLSGHDHIYERTKPQQGIQYFVTGAGGKSRRGGVDLKSAIRATSYDEDNHFMLVEVEHPRIVFQAVSETGRIVDRLEIRSSIV